MREESLVRPLLLTSGRPWDLFLHASWVKAAGGLGQAETGSLVLHIALNGKAHLSGSQSLYLLWGIEWGVSVWHFFQWFGDTTLYWNSMFFIKLFKENKLYGNWLLIITLHFQNNGVRNLFYSAMIYHINKNWQHFYIVRFQMNAVLMNFLFVKE